MKPNETEHGARYGVTFGRLHRDGEQRETSDGFSRDDPLVLANVADGAHTWVVDRAK